MLSIMPGPRCTLRKGFLRQLESSCRALPPIPPATSELACSPDGQAPYAPTASTSQACPSFSLSTSSGGTEACSVWRRAAQKRWDFHLQWKPSPRERRPQWVNTRLPLWEKFWEVFPTVPQRPPGEGSPTCPQQWPTQWCILCWPFSCPCLTSPLSHCAPWGLHPTSTQVMVSGSVWEELTLKKPPPLPPPCSSVQALLASRPSACSSSLAAFPIFVSTLRPEPSRSNINLELWLTWSLLA